MLFSYVCCRSKHSWCFFLFKLLNLFFKRFYVCRKLSRKWKELSSPCPTWSVAETACCVHDSCCATWSEAMRPRVGQGRGPTCRILWGGPVGLPETTPLLFCYLFPS